MTMHAMGFVRFKYDTLNIVMSCIHEIHNHVLIVIMCVITTGAVWNKSIEAPQPMVIGATGAETSPAHRAELFPSPQPFLLLSLLSSFSIVLATNEPPSICYVLKPYIELLYCC